MVMKLRRVRLAGHVAHVGGYEKCVQIFSRKPECKRQLGRSGRRWKDSIRIDVREIEWEVVDWMHVVRIGTMGRGLL
jgi:hypothetical protein